ncbi:MAG: DNA polymerase III subunit delta [Anaerolineales bacterium]
MTERSLPSVYIFHGDDQFAIRQQVAEIQTQLGDDPAMREMNTSRLEGRSTTLDDLRRAANALPFLLKRRLVIFDDPLAKITTAAAQRPLIALLEGLPTSTALLLLFPETLPDPQLDYAYRKKKRHWLLDWATENPERAYVKAFLLPKGAAMSRWIQARAKTQGGAFSIEAASLLSDLVGSDTQAAALEVDKLLLYVNFQRAVEPDDVDLLCASIAEADIFQMVDALGSGQSRIAQNLLTQLLEQQDALSLLGMIVRQFRLLLLTREALDAGLRGENEIGEHVGVSFYVIKKIIPQAQNFRIETLESIYRRLLSIDEDIKTGQVEGDTALHMLVAALA